MYTLQLSDFLFVDIEIGDIFVYRYDDSHFAIREVKSDYRPELNEYAVEILAIGSKRHFRFRRDNGYYWWEEVKY